MSRIAIEGSDITVSDGYHTFDELYTHRNFLFLTIVTANSTGWKSRIHHDGTSYDGYFIVGCKLKGKDITYHVPDDLWDYAEGILELEKAPEWDGHTSDDVVRRMKGFLLQK